MRALRLWQEAQLLDPRCDDADDLDTTPTLPAHEIAQLRMEARP